jgi:hypothetical protein
MHWYVVPRKVTATCVPGKKANVFAAPILSNWKDAWASAMQVNELIANLAVL